MQSTNAYEQLSYIYSMPSTPMSVTKRSKVWVYGRSLAEIVGSNAEGSMDFCVHCCLLSGRGLCDGLITRPEESYRLWCVVVCDLETSRMRRPWSALGRSATGKKSISTCFGCSCDHPQINIYKGYRLLRKRFDQMRTCEILTVEIHLIRSFTMCGLKYTPPTHTHIHTTHIHTHISSNIFFSNLHICLTENLWNQWKLLD